MIYQKTFSYKPFESECEKASNSYLMSLIVVMAGLPLPIVNLISSVVFFVSNRRSTYFVRWHCMQSILLQVSFFILNCTVYYWAWMIYFGRAHFGTAFIVHGSIVLLLNILEYTAVIAAAVLTRKGIHVEWILFGRMTNALCKK